MVVMKKKKKKNQTMIHLHLVRSLSCAGIAMDFAFVVHTKDAIIKSASDSSFCITFIMIVVATVKIVNLICVSVYASISSNE